VLGELKAGEHVLIHAAASGVGIAAIQVARLCGSRPRPRPHRLTTRRATSGLSTGATAGVDYKTQDFAKEVERDGRGTARTS
jgi:NADPH:quinone reductase-like Zn-dependent oxidoreductase